MNRTFLSRIQFIHNRLRFPQLSLFWVVIYLSLTAMFLGSCQHLSDANHKSPQFSYPFLNNSDWKGKAEIAIYRGDIQRYNQKRPARLVLITVLEPFNLQQRVKALQNQNVPYAIKQNQALNYQTGVYPYSQMNSVFWNHSDGRLIKANMTSQEWCGQSFKEAIPRGSNLELNYNSYWESEATGSRTITSPENALLYDELPMVVRSPDFQEKTSAGIFPLLMSSQVFQPAWDIMEPRQPDLKYNKASIKQKKVALKFKGRNYSNVLQIEISTTQPDGALFVDTFFVDQDHPNRILLRWERYDGSVLNLEELYYSPYWDKNKNGDRFTNNRLK